MSKFKAFLEFFQEQEPPILLGEDASLAFSRENKPLPIEAIQEFILPYEPDELDEFTEIVPGVLLKYNDYNLVIYWKASLLHYQYVLLVFDKIGRFIDRSIIGGTVVDEDTVLRSAARIDEDYIINIASSRGHASSPLPTGDYQNFTLEVGNDGFINTIQ